jgi:hypothetical protein
LNLQNLRNQQNITIRKIKLEESRRMERTTYLKDIKIEN